MKVGSFRVGREVVDVDRVERDKVVGLRKRKILCLLRLGCN